MESDDVDPAEPLHLFQGYGIELEYMIVDEALGPFAVSDEVLREAAGELVTEVEMGPLCWSNELVLHVIELKTNGPAPSLEALPSLFQSDIQKINAMLKARKGRLMPTGMHPWMDPERDTRIWPHEVSEIYEAFNRIFGCRGHGWSNLQSIHLNLPFADDEEFGRLHAAIRILLPIMPALAASTPIFEGRISGFHDSRMEVYRTNSARIPSITGSVVPEPIYTQKNYEELLQEIYRDIAPFDQDGVLQFEWLNARGAIARFDRDAIEIRILDVQECPLADLAVCAAISRVLKALTEEHWTDMAIQKAWPVQPLADLFLNIIRQGETTRISDRAYLELFGFPNGAFCTAAELWTHLIQSVFPDLKQSVWNDPLSNILRRGTLSTRILKALGQNASREKIQEVYARLAQCLDEEKLFKA